MARSDANRRRELRLIELRGQVAKHQHERDMLRRELAALVVAHGWHAPATRALALRVRELDQAVRAGLIEIGRLRTEASTAGAAA
jgi:hypothetical protein